MGKSLLLRQGLEPLECQECEALWATGLTHRRCPLHRVVVRHADHLAPVTWKDEGEEGEARVTPPWKGRLVDTLTFHRRPLMDEYLALMPCLKPDGVWRLYEGECLARETLLFDVVKEGSDG